MVVLQVLPSLVPQFGCSVAWLDNILVYWLCHMLIRHCPCTNKMATYPWPMILHVTISTTLGMTWYICRSSFQIWSHSLVDMWLGWPSLYYIDCVSCMSDLVHALTRHIEWVAPNLWPMVLHIITIRWWFCWSSCQICSHSLGAKLPDWTVSQSIDCVPVLSDLAHAPILWEA